MPSLRELKHLGACLFAKGGVMMRDIWAIGMALVVTRRIDRMKIASSWNKRGAGYGTTGGVQA